MASDWIKTTLDDVCIKITDGAHKSPKSVDSGKPMASVKDLEFYGLNLETARHISEEDYDDLVKQGCKPELGDVLIAKDGNSALDTVCTFEKDAEVVLLSSVAILRPNPAKINSRFLKYYFLSSRTVEYLKRNFISGAAIPRVVLRDFKKAEISLPLMPEQKAIAHILGSLDDKIELNRQMNETLEAMAQALFKSWFVDFDPVIDNALAAGNAIPDEFTERAEQRKGIEKKYSSDIQDLFPDEFELTEEMGWIPKGGEVTPLAALIKLTGGGTPKTSIPEYWNGDIPWFSVVDAPSSSDIFVLDTEKHVTSLGVENSSTKILSVGTTIISARGTVGKCAMVSRPMAMNQSCYGVSGNEGISNTFVYYFVFPSVSELQRKGHGSVFNTITGDTFKSINVAFSGGRLTREFDNLVSPYFEKILANSLQAKTLSKLRDTLLPKLMSGELRISDVIF
ncbi:restriction endonuclease subunit S [Psychrobacter cibarius]|uniref:restriction endonuclease subunit S n=1 Tax=Psychrobacter cibarius TaxID=282669 RepID=UPI001918FD84|nr:restriction endonuclease subunit S [Psychrobacter cibarius]